MEPLNQTHSLTDFSSWRGEVKCGVKCGSADLRMGKLRIKPRTMVCKLPIESDLQ